jgi:hypothetical protein
MEINLFVGKVGESAVVHGIANYSALLTTLTVSLLRVPLLCYGGLQDQPLV